MSVDDQLLRGAPVTSSHIRHQLESLVTDWQAVLLLDEEEFGGADEAAAHRASARAVLLMLAAALRRLEDGTYGRCVECSAAVAAERLEIIPYADTCVSCAQRRSRR